MEETEQTEKTGCQNGGTEGSTEKRSALPGVIPFQASSRRNAESLNKPCVGGVCMRRSRNAGGKVLARVAADVLNQCMADGPLTAADVEAAPRRDRRTCWCVHPRHTKTRPLLSRAASPTPHAAAHATSGPRARRGPWSSVLRMIAEFTQRVPEAPGAVKRNHNYSSQRRQERTVSTDLADALAPPVVPGAVLVTLGVKIRQEAIDPQQGRPRSRSASYRTGRDQLILLAPPNTRVATLPRNEGARNVYECVRSCGLVGCSVLKTRSLRLLRLL